MSLSFRAAIASLPVYKPGKPAAPGPSGVSYKLSSNENPFPPLPGVLEQVQASCGQMNRYPDASNSAVALAVAEHLTKSGYACAPEQLAFGAGSVSVLYNMLQTVCEVGDEVVFAWRSFEAYPLSAQVSGAKPVMVDLGPGATHDLDAMRAAITDRTRAILVCTPNNPTGPAIGHDRLAAFIDSIPDHILVMVDEAYVEFVTDPHAARGLELLAGRPNVAVLRTFSKSYGLAGFRVGYCVAEEKLAEATRSVSVPFGVSLPAQAAVMASLQASDALLERVSHIVEEREKLATGLRDLGFEVPDTQANFVWLPAREQTQAYADTFAAAGVAVRPYAAGDDNDGVRITVGEPEANRLVLEMASRLSR